MEGEGYLEGLGSLEGLGYLEGVGSLVGLRSPGGLGRRVGGPEIQALRGGKQQQSKPER